MKKNKWRWGWLLVAGIVAVWLLWPKNKTDVTEKKTWENQKVAELYADSYLPTELKTPKEIEWNIEEVNSQDKAAVWWYETNGLMTMASELLKEVGMKEEDKSLENGITTTFSDKTGRSVYVNNERQELEYVWEIRSKGQLWSNQKKDVGKIKDDLTEMLTRINGTKVTISWEEVRYMKMYFPRWTEALEPEAEAIEIRGDYWLEGKKLKTYYGNSVVAIVRNDGELFKLMMVAVPTTIKVENEKKRAGIEELKHRKLETLGVVRIEGGIGFENTGEIGEIGKIIINKVELVTIMDTRGGRLRSYYWLSGSARSSEPLKVELITGAR